jgi:hypothetical protein
MPVVSSVPLSTKVSVIIQDALFAARVLGQDQTVQAGDAALVLRRLNRMMDQWANDSLMIYSNSTESFTMVAGQAQYSTTVLPNGRPIGIDGIRINTSGIDYHVDLITQLVWNDIPYKATQGIPASCFYDASFVDGAMNFYVVPAGAYTCYVDCRRVLTGTMTIDSYIVLPPGYEGAIVDSLAVDIWPSFRKEPIPIDLYKAAQNAKRLIKRTNYQPLIMNTVFDRPYSDYRYG